MKTFKYLLAVVLFTPAAIMSGVVSPVTGSAQAGDEVAACRVLRNLAQNSRDWAEVITYKNAFDYARRRVRDRGSISQDERYFDQLVQNNGGAAGIICLSLNRAPKANCGFRNHETVNLVETIEEKMKKDNLSIQDIIRAVQNAQPAHNPTKFTPLENER